MRCSQSTGGSVALLESPTSTVSGRRGSTSCSSPPASTTMGMETGRDTSLPGPRPSFATAEERETSVGWWSFSPYPFHCSVSHSCRVVKVISLLFFSNVMAWISDCRIIYFFFSFFVVAGSVIQLTKMEWPYCQKINQKSFVPP